MASTSTHDFPPLVLTMGDPAGIGPDIALAAWSRRIARQIPPFVVLGDARVLAERAKSIGLAVIIETVDSPRTAARVYDTALPVLPIPLDVAVRAGVPEPIAAPAIVAAIETAVALIRDGDATALVTNPIGKAVLYSGGFAHPGHTEFLAELARAWHQAGERRATPEPAMMLVCEGLRTVPVTIHLPLKEVFGRLTREAIVRTGRIAARALVQDFGIASPRLAVAGLNPHAGESGGLGREEIEIVAPAVQVLRDEGLNVSGPHSADAMFSERARADYDAAIAMYHDQALIPVKALDFDNAVNVTLGLPFVRTSPDHGTAYDIAGTGRADPSSLIAALKLAAQIAVRRRRAS